MFSHTKIINRPSVAGTAKHLASYQSPVEEKRVAGCPSYVEGGEGVFL